MSRERFQDWYEDLPDFKSNPNCTCKSLFGAKIELCFYLGKSWVQLHRLEATADCSGGKALGEIVRRADE